MITISDAAELLGTYPKHVRRLIERGELTGAVKLSSKRTSPFLIPLKVVKAYQAKLEKERAAKPGGSTAR